MFLPVTRAFLDTWFYWVPAALTIYWAVRETIDLIRA